MAKGKAYENGNFSFRVYLLHFRMCVEISL